MATVADYSAGKPGARALKAAGFIGANRYIGFSDPRDNRTPKCTTRAELEDFTREGLGMALVFESRADDWRGGYSAGHANYQIARRHANEIGFPSDRPIYMAVDSEVIGAANHALMYQYLRGARDAAGGNAKLVGVYGQFSVCQYLWDASEPVVHWYWQCRAWSGTPIRYFGPRHLFQHVGLVYAGPIPCDVNDVLQKDWGQHIGGSGVSRQDVFDAFAHMAGDPYGPEAENLRAVVWHFLFPKAPDDEIVELPEGGTNASSPFLEMKWNAHNFQSVLDAIEANAGNVNVSPEQWAQLVSAIAGVVPSAEANAKATVAELKKEGN